MIARVLISAPLAFAVMLAGGGAELILLTKPCRAAGPVQSESDQQRDQGESQSTPSGRPINPRNPGGPQYLPQDRQINPDTPGGAASIVPPYSAPSTYSADLAPPKHRHAAVSHSMAASHHPSRFPNLEGNSVANQLNQAELARLQSGNFSPPPATPPSGMASPPPPGLRPHAGSSGAGPR
jgi:hypothetical protein